MGLTPNTLYDFFAYDNAGTVAIELVAWANSGEGTSSRQSALIYKDGALIKESDSRKFLGTLLTDAGGNFTFSLNPNTEGSGTQKITLWHQYNRVSCPIESALTPSLVGWTYKGGTRALNGRTDYRQVIVNGSQETIPAAYSASLGISGDVSTAFSLGLNSTSQPYGGVKQSATNDTYALATLANVIPIPPGNSFVQMLEEAAVLTSALFIPGNTNVMRTIWEY